MPDTASKSNLIPSALKIWLVPAVLILAAQGAALHVLSIPEEHLVIPQLSKIPSQLGDWTSVREQTLESRIGLERQTALVHPARRTTGDRGEARGALT